MSRNQRRKKRNKPGSSQNANRSANRDNTKATSAGVVHRRSSTETKSSLRTTEFIAYAGAVLAVRITALAVDEDGRGGNDPFGADSAIRYITSRSAMPVQNFNPAWEPDARSVLFVHAQFDLSAPVGDIYRADLRTGRQTPVSQDPRFEFRPAATASTARHR